MCFFSTAFTQSSIKCSYSGIKRSGNEADHSLPSNAEFKNKWRCNSAPPLQMS